MISVHAREPRSGLDAVDIKYNGVRDGVNKHADGVLTVDL